jgi:glycine cleavage system aminomethyltransferase T/glycine/D-amino acid oxidase-like deaminating enzyme
VSQPVPARAQVVIVGGGVVGCAVAYHLTRRGWTDVVLVERKKLTSGTTWHAAGLITQARGTSGLRRIVQQSLEVFRDLEAQTGIGYQRTGTVHLAATPDRWEELRRQASSVAADGVVTEVLAPDELPPLFPLLDPAGLVGGVYYPEDGRGNATDTTLAMARAAKAAGATLLENTSAVEVLVTAGVVRGVRTDVGDIEAEYVVNATGMWGRSFGATHGANLPLQALEHYYVVTEDVPGLGSGLPTLKSSDDCAYVKDDAGKMLVGFFEPGSRPWSSRGIPPDTEFATMAGEWDHITPFYERIAARIPALADLGIRLFFCGPESFTPDGTYHLGPVPGLTNYLAAVGFNSVGFLSGPGAGKVVADWLVDGRAPFALTETDPRRAQPFQSNRRYLEERVTETLDLSYGVHWPFEQRTSARGIRRTPLHDRVAAAGAVFGEVAGWERANWYARDGVEPRYVNSFGRPNWQDCADAEHLAVRTGLGLFDLSSFGKLLVQGRDAVDVLQRVSAGDVDVEVGRIVYTQWLNDDAGIEADVTVTRLAADEFVVLTAALSTVRDADWLRRAATPDDFVTVTDVTNSWALLALMGPLARSFLVPLTDADLSDAGFGFGTSRVIDLGYTHVRATRITYVGELGWELLVPTESAVHVYDTLLAAARATGTELTHAGYHALNSLRLEKAYRSWGHDLGPDDTPLEAGLGFAVAWDKPAFTGRGALLRQRAAGVRRRLVQLVLDPTVAGAPAPMVFHDEPVFRDGALVGTVTSAAYGATVGATVALAYLRSPEPVTDAWVSAGRYEVEVAGLRVPATVSLRPAYDPTSARPRTA